MAHLEGVTRSELRAALERVDDAKPATRLIAAIAYKSGVSQTDLADWFGVERKTIYNWLTRLEAGDLPDAAADNKRPGRSRKLSSSQYAELRDKLADPPDFSGYDAPGWSPVLLKRMLHEEFDVEYSIPSCRRLMKEAGLTYEQPGDWKQTTTDTA